MIIFLGLQSSVWIVRELLFCWWKGRKRKDSLFFSTCQQSFDLCVQEESENVYSALHVEFSCIHSLTTVCVSSVLHVQPPDYYMLVIVIMLDVEILEMRVPVMNMYF